MIEVTVEYLERGIWVPHKIELDVDVDMALSDETLDQEMCDLPRKIARYAEVSAELHALAARRKSEVEWMEADTAQEVRKAHAAAGTKITEPGIKEAVAVSAVVTAVRNNYYHADKEFRMVDGFYRGLREKASLAIALCYKQKAEITAMSGPLN